MSYKSWLILMGAVLVAAAAALWAVIPGSAQCGDDLKHSSCITCHEEQASVYAEGEWHIIHARKDCCAACHGGNCTTMDKELAHAGMVAQPLQDIYTDCRACHPEDYTLRAKHFATLLGVTPGSSPTPTPRPAAKTIAQKMVILPQTTQTTPPNSTAAMAMISVAFALGLLVGLWILSLRLKAA
jgi:hypothetical protein